MDATRGSRKGWASGAVDGAAATLAMSGLMLAARRAGWLGEMPPRRITRFALRHARIPLPSRKGKSALAALAHVGFGAAAGSLFEGVVPARWVRRPGLGPAAGAAFGMAVWLVSYAGWVPALGILPPPHRDRPGRQPAMILAHLVYGAVLGALADRRGRRAAGTGTTVEIRAM